MENNQRSDRTEKRAQGKGFPCKMSIKVELGKGYHQGNYITEETFQKSIPV